MVTGVTGGYQGLQKVRKEYKKCKGVTRGYRGL